MQELSAPDSAVGSESRSIEGEADGFLQAMLRHDRENVGKVVLDRKPRWGGSREVAAVAVSAREALLCPAGRPVQGVQVVDDPVGPHVVHLLHGPHLRVELGESAGILEVPQVGGEMNVISPREGRGAFQVSAQAEHHSLDRGGRGDEPGHEAARPPQEERAGCGPCPDDGVVCPGDYGPVVHEEPVCHSCEHLQRLQGISDDGLVGPVARGHDEAAVRDLLARQLEKKDVQGRVGEHQAEGVCVGDRQQLGSRHRGVLPAGAITIGLSGEASISSSCFERQHRARASSRSLTISAKGLLRLSFAARSLAIARGCRGSAAR